MYAPADEPHTIITFGYMPKLDAFYLTQRTDDLTSQMVLRGENPWS